MAEQAYIYQIQIFIRFLFLGHHIYDTAKINDRYKNFGNDASFDNLCLCTSISVQHKPSAECYSGTWSDKDYNSNIFPLGHIREARASKY